MSVNPADRVQDARARIGAALGRLEAAVDGGVSTGEATSILERQVQNLTTDRAKMAEEIDDLKRSNARLQSTHGDVSKRLDAAIDRVETLLHEDGDAWPRST